MAVRGVRGSLSDERGPAGRQLAALARAAHDGVSRETGPADQVERDGERGVEARLPAYSGSTPIIWGDRIFLNVATANNTGELELWAVDRTKPTVLWKRPIAGGNHIERKQNMSSPSPVTDGKTVWVMTGVGMLKAFDFAGKELWSRDIQTDYGRFGLNWGYASSPLLHGDALYVQVLHGMKTDDPSYVLKIDKLDGQDDVEGRAADRRAAGVAGFLHDAAARADEGADRDRHHRRRRGHGARSGDRQGTVARERPQSAESRRLPHRRVAADRRRLDRRRRAATTRSPRSARAAPATSRHRTSRGRSSAAPTCRRRSATARTCMSSSKAASCFAWT